MCFPGGTEIALADDVRGFYSQIWGILDSLMHMDSIQVDIWQLAAR